MALVKRAKGVLGLCWMARKMKSEAVRVALDVPFKITAMDVSTPIPLVDDISDLKATNSRLEIFVSIGGWTFSDNDTYTQPVFGNIARSSENRQLVADEVASFLTYYGFDEVVGVDMDWQAKYHCFADVSSDVNIIHFAYQSSSTPSNP
ncbi:hypothetical protein E4U27_007671 [Claviceps purpurea]|nr:hypothetical protein E4U27_007671 [Claviceps purpurea]